MIVVDSSAVIAILLSEPEQDALVYALAQSDARVISTTNVLESVQVALTKLGESGRLCVELLLAESGIAVTAFDQEQLSHAIDAFIRFGRGSGQGAKLNFGDCMAYALAKSLDAPLLFKGGDFAKTDIRSAL